MSLTADQQKSLNSLKTKRSFTKAAITRIKTFIDQKQGDLLLGELECRLGLLEAYFKQLLAVQDKIGNIDSDEANSTVMCEIEDSYCSIKATLLNMIGVQKKRDSLSISVDEANRTIASPSISSIMLKSNLPKLQLPQFAGQYIEYTNFINTFKLIVDSNNNLDSIEKLIHLRSCLKGEALVTIQALEINANNYTKALKLLDSRYNNKYLIFESHLSHLFNIPAITRAAASSIRKVVDHVNVHLKAMQSLGSDNDILNAVIIHVVKGKLDQQSKSKWEESLNVDKLPTWDNFSDFLQKRCQVIEGNEVREHPKAHATSSARVSSKTSLAISKPLCAKCNQNDHTIHKCSAFLNLPVMDRFKEVKQLNLCINCLNKGHSVKSCLSSKCRVCSLPHHSLLHRYSTAVKPGPSPSFNNQSASCNANQTSITLNKPETSPPPASLHASVAQSYADQVILATAIVNVRNKMGQFTPVRVLLDSASQLNLMTQSLAKKLQLSCKGIQGQISGIGDTSSTVAYATNATIMSRINEFQAHLEVWIIPTITSVQPEARIDISDWNIPQNISLADPGFNIPHKVDMLLGADVFYQLLSVGHIRLGENLPMLQKTLFGWIVAGRFKEAADPSHRICNIAVDKDVELVDNKLMELVENFWKIEHINDQVVDWNKEQRECEKFFVNTVERNESGRFIVQLPFKKDPNLLGDSFAIALRNFARLERRLERDPDLKNQYIEFMNEYEQLGHMQEWTGDTANIKYFIPHHCVLKPDSSSTKLRVVFNASCPTSSGISLNDILMVGPTVQEDLFNIAIRFRCRKYAITADISKMYRQILINPQDRQFLGILWRPSSTVPLKNYALATVTYGTSSAPYQATRCLVELANEFAETLPVGSHAIRKDMYVDDLLSGANSLEQLIELKHQIVSILNSGGFALRKWSSNCAAFMDLIPVEDRETTVTINNSNAVKALGLIWNPTSDEFQFAWPFATESSRITKRTVLSDLSKLFDPLGLINPIIVTAKIFMKELWRLKLNWDESLPIEHHTRWINYRCKLNDVTKIRLPRPIYPDNCSMVQLHGFADASEEAYGCCIYMRSVTTSGDITVKLITSKSRVSPNKVISLPRLELCAALLLSTLVKRLRSIIEPFPETILWTDSEIVLHWIAGESSAWNTFVANRVSKIQAVADINHWRHVESKLNPADIISRGATIDYLIDSIWFCGPPFLSQANQNWPRKQKFQPYLENLPEKRATKSVLTLHRGNHLPDFISEQKYVNNASKLCRIFAFALRFIKKLALQLNCKGYNLKNLTLNISNPIEDILSYAEINEALMRIIYAIQRSAFSSEIKCLENEVPLDLKSSIISLSPFIDNSTVSLLRVGGRLQKANIPYDAKYPILLPRNHPFVKGYVTELHRQLLHAGSQALLSIVRQRFWILGAKVLCTQVLRKCIHCFRYRPKTFSQIMGNLPASRVEASWPFLVTGVDFCGPIWISLQLRGKPLVKAYIAVFVCFATKAVHLEAVSDLSSDAFIAALKRFVARRGVCSKLVCDNATNFVGAKSKLKELYQLFCSEQSKKDIVEACMRQGITFEFIPPRSPHFGGLWEAAVKSAKHHLYRTIHQASLSFEELSTLVAQIEAILNSRPITALSSDPNDEQALTPGHFLIGHPLVAIPEPDVSNEPLSSTKRWERLSTLQQHFWRRWSHEYVPLLQQRHKWSTSSPDVKENMLVLIADDQQPPQNWLLGRIVKTFAGSDGHVRVAEVKTKGKIVRRAIHKLAPLPLTD